MVLRLGDRDKKLLDVVRPYDRRTRFNLKKLTEVLFSIARDRRLENPEIATVITRNKLLRVVDHKSTLPRYESYARRIGPWPTKANNIAERWVRYLVRLESNRNKLKSEIKRLKETQQPKRKRVIEEKRRNWIQDAVSVRLKPEKLNDVQRRAVKLLLGGRTQKGRIGGHGKEKSIEERAADLAHIVKRDWFSKNNPKGKVGASQDVSQPRLTITDVISIATPIIEEFAGGPIAYWKQRRSSGSLSFEALYFMTRAFTDEANQRKTTESQLSRSTVSRLLRKFRKRKSVQTAQNEDLVRVDIAPELRAWMQ